MPYPKSNKEIQDSAFTMRSGNTTPFKQMGSSAFKQIQGMWGMPAGPFNRAALGVPGTTVSSPSQVATGRTRRRF